MSNSRVSPLDDNGIEDVTIIAFIVLEWRSKKRRYSDNPLSKNEMWYIG